MAESSENSSKDTPMAESSTKKPHVTFSFQLQPAWVMKAAVDALSDPTLNPTKMGMMEVSQRGFEITVRKGYSPAIKNQVYGFLRLKASRVYTFQCRKPVRKLLNLRDVSTILDAAASASGYADYEDRYLTLMVIYEEDSSKLSFQIGKSTLDFALGKPSSVGVNDLKQMYGKFLDVSYGFDAAISRNALTELVGQVMQMKPKSRPRLVSMSLKPAVVHMEVDGVELSEPEQEHYLVQFKWLLWESLERALHLSRNCSVYLVTEPDQHILLRFDVQGLGDMVYLSPAKFNSVPDLPYLGQFSSLTWS